MRHDDPLLGQQLRSARLVRGWTQLQLAERAGIDPQRIGPLERGVTRHPDPAVLAALVQALALPPSWVLQAELLLSGEPEAASGP